MLCGWKLSWEAKREGVCAKEVTGWVADTGDGREMGRRDVNWGQITAVATTGTRFSVNIGSTHKATDVGKHL